jgi:hypothetical protein
MAKAKAPAAFTITVNFTQAQLNKIANAAIGHLNDDFETSTIKAAGYTIKGLLQAVTEDKEFRSEIEDALSDRVYDLVNDPYDYDIGYGNQTMLKALQKACGEEMHYAEQKVQDAKYEQENKASAVKQAVELLKAAGFTVSVPAK